MSSRKIAYLINQYPKVSHTFIRREILALEHQGWHVLRIAMQGWDDVLADEVDVKERVRCKYVMQGGLFPVLVAMLRALFAKPWKFLPALALAVQMSRNSERALPYHLVYLAEACRILPWLKTFGAAHIHAHFGTNSAEIAMLVNALGGPSYSFTVHGQDELLFGGNTEKVRRAAFVVAISNFGRSQLYRRIPHSYWHKIHIIHCGLEPAYLTLSPAPLPDNSRLICVGRLSIEKGQLLLIEAAHLLSSKGLRFELVLAGDGEMRADVEDLIRRYNLTRQVRITGWISSNQVREEIMLARGLVLPSFTEGLPVVIMEAMALRRPVLATYVGGIPELVIHNQTGWLFPAGAVEELAAAIQDWLSKPVNELQEMGNTGYNRVAQRHAIDTEAAKLAELFKNFGYPNTTT